MTANPEQAEPAPRVKSKRPRSTGGRARWWPLVLALLAVAVLVAIAALAENQIQSSQAASRATMRVLWMGNLALTYQAGTQTQDAAAVLSAVTPAVSAPAIWPEPSPPPTGPSP